jgi:serine/threonine-protein kinase
MAPDDVIHSTPAAAPPASPAENVDGELKRIGRYDLIEKIGRGGMGVVYRGRDTVIGRPVAVKMLISDIDVSDEARQRFFREARSAGQLAHRNIITIYDFGEEGGRAYIVMELLTGESLTNLLTRGVKLPLEQQVEIMMRVSEGLAFAHARGIVHRDVKPANLFVTTDGQVKILDFGVARIASSKLTRSGLLVGTPDYMSPEQVMGVIVDQRSDVFSAGAVFYQLLTGRKPFAAKRLPDVLNRVRLEQPEPVTEAEAPAELTAIVM